MAEAKVRVVIAGRVQGVWFRGWAQEIAGQAGLNGWIRNRRDGTVEAVFAGEAAKVEAMVRACHQGPPMAKVTGVERFAYDQPVERGFRPLPSA